MTSSAANKAGIDAAVAVLLNSVTAEQAAPTLDISKFTEADVTGKGVFDTVMTSCAALANAEFRADRIRGTDYASFYLGMVQAALTTSAQFTLEWDKAAVEKLAVLTNLQLSLAQAELADKQRELVEAQILTQAEETLYKKEQVKLATAEIANKVEQTKLTKAQVSLFVQKVVTEMAETNTTIPANVASAADISTVVPLVSNKINGTRGANRDVALEQRAGYMRKAQHDLIKIATGHVDMLVSSGAATDVGDYTRQLLNLLKTGSATGDFTASSLLAKAVADATTLQPSATDSQ